MLQRQCVERSEISGGPNDPLGRSRAPQTHRLVLGYPPASLPDWTQARFDVELPAACPEAIEHYAGTVTQYLGDGLSVILAGLRRMETTQYARYALGLSGHYKDGPFTSYCSNGPGP